MAVPSSYTEATLKAFVMEVLGPMAGVFGWTDSDNSLDEVVNDTLSLCGVESIADVKNVHKLRAMARVATWHRVMEHAATKFTFSDAGSSFNRRQIHDMAKQNLQRAETAALRFDDTYKVNASKLSFRHNPYRYIPDDERTP